jgi:hypothetical protein
MKNFISALRLAFTLCAMGLAASGCAHSIHEVHTSDFSPYRPASSGQFVKASAEQFTILGFVDDTDYVDHAYRKLADTCPGGTVTGITTQLSTSLGFFSWTNKVLMQGLCVK